MSPAKKWMEKAIAIATQGIQAGQSPFGSVIVKNDKVVAATHNTVWRDTDPTAHAEVNAIRSAAQTLQTIELTGCSLYSTCEPCPMCLAAIHWARIDRVVYGATIADAARTGFNELHLTAKEMASRGGSALVVEVGPCVDECRQLFEMWLKMGKGGKY